MPIAAKTSHVLLLAAMTVIMYASVCLAVMPPYVYENAVNQSRIKAMATVVRVETVSSNDYSHLRLVTFKLDKAVGPGQVPAEFQGTCHTAIPGADMPVGGTIYYDPQPGERVYVTVSRNGQDITSYTPLTPELEQALLQAPQTVRTSFGKAFVSP